QHDPIPVIGALSALFPQPFELGRAIVQVYAFAEHLTLLFAQFAHQTHGVLPLHFETRMGQPIGQLAAGGENEQPARVVIQPANRYPFSAAHSWKLVEYTGASLRVVSTDDLSLWLVVDQNARQFLMLSLSNRPAVKQNTIVRPD